MLAHLVNAGVAAANVRDGGLLSAFSEQALGRAYLPGALFDPRHRSVLLNSTTERGRRRSSETHQSFSIDEWVTALGSGAYYQTGKNCAGVIDKVMIVQVLLVDHRVG